MGLAFGHLCQLGLRFAKVVHCDKWGCLTVLLQEGLTDTCMAGQTSGWGC
jgi:hypothetical protein